MEVADPNAHVACITQRGCAAQASVEVRAAGSAGEVAVVPARDALKVERARAGCWRRRAWYRSSCPRRLAAGVKRHAAWARGVRSRLARGAGVAQRIGATTAAVKVLQAACAVEVADPSARGACVTQRGCAAQAPVEVRDTATAGEVAVVQARDALKVERART